MSQDQPHSIWLVPEAKSAAALRSAINCLAEELGCPAFEPHITVAGDLQSAPITTMSHCQKQLAGSSPFDVSILGTERSNPFFMSLFLDVKIGQDFWDFSQSIFETLEIAHPTTFRPHISLAYGLDCKLRIPPKTLAIIDRFLGQRIVFDRLSIVRSAKEIPISEWTTLSELDLKN